MSKLVDINNMDTEIKPKKSKAPVVIIILLVLAIIALVSIILFVFKVDVIQVAKELFDVREPASAVSMEYTEYQMGVGQEMELQINLTPKNTKTGYTLSSSDDSIVSVDQKEHTLKALKCGSCTVKVVTTNYLEATARIDVLQPPTKLDIKSEDILFISDALRVTTSTGRGESSGSVVYKCSDEGKAKISKDGIVTPILAGEVTITATTYNGISASKKIKICKPVSKLNLSQSRAVVANGTELTLECALEKDEYSSSIEFSSDNETVASVDDKGHVSTYKEGKAIIKAKADNNVTAACELIVADDTPVIRKNLDKTKPMIALTFDDGPSAENTSSILNTLDKYKGKATFFVVGNRVESNSELLKTMYDSGHEIGNHSWDHSYADDMDETEQQIELIKANEAVYDVLGCIPSVFRCPGGIEGDYYNENAGVPIIYWSVDTRDWETGSSKATYERLTSVFDRGLNLDGDIILMHDIQDSTPEAVKNICAYLNKRGYQFVTVSELAYYRGVDMEDGEGYSYFYPDKPNTENTEKATEKETTKKSKETTSENEEDE